MTRFYKQTSLYSRETLSSPSKIWADVNRNILVSSILMSRKFTAVIEMAYVKQKAGLNDLHSGNTDRTSTTWLQEHLRDIRNRETRHVLFSPATVNLFTCSVFWSVVTSSEQTASISCFKETYFQGSIVVATLLFASTNVKWLEVLRYHLSNRGALTQGY